MKSTGVKPVRLLALDLDDTLLRSDLSISYRTRGAVKKAEAAGLTVALASSRAPQSMEKYARFLGMHRYPGYLISNNGAVIQESCTGNLLYEARLDTNTALIAYDLAAAEGFAVQIYEDDVLYVSKPNEYADFDQKITGLRQVVVENFRDMVSGGCYRLIIPGDPVLLSPIRSILEAYLGPGVTLFAGKPYRLEILPRDCSKGTSLARLAERLGVRREEVLAAGDSMSDEAMLRWAGIGVAMINGDERIKRIANLVSGRSNDDDGVADIIERYILGNEEPEAHQAKAGEHDH